MGISRNILPVNDCIYIRTLSHSLLLVDVHVIFAQDCSTARLNKTCSTVGPQLDITYDMETSKPHAS